MTTEDTTPPGADDLIRGAIELLRCEEKKWMRRPNPLWMRIGSVFGFRGEAWQSAICVRYGFDPREIYKP